MLLDERKGKQIYLSYSIYHLTYNQQVGIVNIGNERTEPHVKTQTKFLKNKQSHNKS